MEQKSSPQGRGFVFRHFNRKGYALFSALGREVKVGVLTVATLSTAAPALAAGAGIAAHHPLLPVAGDVSGLDDDRLLSEAVTTASRTPMAADVAARPVVVLQAAELAAAGVSTVNDVLKLCAGVDVRQRGAFGMQTDISIAGGTFDQITFLIDGVAVNNPHTGHNAADFPLNLSDIERIEVLEGAASRVLGTQAFSGAVNIVTRRTPGAAAAASGGSHGTAFGELRLADQRRWADRPDRLLSWNLSGGTGRSDGAVANSDFRSAKAFAQARYEDEAFRLTALFGHSDKTFGANTFYSAAYPNQWEGTERQIIALRGETKGRWHLSPQVSWLRNEDHFQLIRNTHTAENFHLGDVFTLGVNAWTQWRLGRTAFGAEMREERIRSTNLGLPLDTAQWQRIGGKTPVLDAEGRWVDRNGGAAFYTRRMSRTNLSYFLEHNLLFHRWTLSLGVLAQRNSALDDTFRFYPGVDVACRPSERWTLTASWNRALRLPTFTDLFYKSPTQQGNVGLKPEECSTFRCGADLRPVAGVQLSVGGFFQRGTDMIDWVMRSPEDVYRSTNFQLDNYGLSATAEVLFAPLLGSDQPLTRLHLDFARLWQERKDDQPVFKSNYALEYLRHKLVATLDHRITSHLGASWTFRLQDRNGRYQVFDPATRKAVPGVLAPYGTHGRLDLKLHWTTARYSLYLDLQNLTGHRAYDLGNVEQPGFLLMAGAKVNI